MYLLLLLLYCITEDVAAISCPPECNSACATLQLSCLICLSGYYQTINVTTRVCSCLSGYQPYQNLDTYCCPIGCKSCNQNGCSECPSNQIILFNVSLRANTCVCKQNYVMNSQLQCRCSSNTQPSLYYFDTLNIKCLPCPEECVCSSQGCVSCSTSSNRNIIKYQFRNYTCACQTGFQELNRKCVCPSDCDCSNPENISCSSASNRYNSSGDFKCIWPYQNVNNECLCVEPWKLTADPDGNITCECGSKDTPTEYFRYKNQCSLCYEGCTCNNQGCSSCFITFIESYGGDCYCTNNYTLSDSKCECLFPYYKKSLTSSQCYCLSQLDTSRFQYIKSLQTCYPCPHRCTCNSSGCISCEVGSLRTVTKLSDTQFICPCVMNTFQSPQGLCFCRQIYTSQNNSCVCNSSVLEAIIYYDQDSDFCQYCPLSCLCDSTGCYECSTQSYRVISTNSLGIKTCYCGQNFVSENYSQRCICLNNYTFNSQTTACDCVAPFYLTESGECRCMSESDPIQYFWDSIENQCYYCPYNCICNSTGCVQCKDEALRYVMYDYSNDLWVCSCLQNAFLIGNYCTICSSEYYYYSGDCVYCSGCSSCDTRGCLACPQNLTLDNYTCSCDSPFINRAGECSCEDGYSYVDFDLDDASCRKCPTYCSICIITEEADVCLMCPTSGHRTDSPSRNCECEEGYIEAYPMQVYCCHYSCQTCNQTSCLTCPLYSYRQISDNVCACIFPLVEVDKGACVCNDSFYLMNGTCYACPLSCKTCSYSPNTTFVQCTSCYQGMNRNTSDINCSCLDGYNQTKPIQSAFCVLQHCSQDVAECTTCLYSRVISNGICACPPSTFENYFFKCQDCNIEGCHLCQQYFLCYSCLTSQNYYLSNLRCYYSDINSPSMVSYVGTKKLLIQFKLELEMDKYIGCSLSIVRIQSPDNIKTYNPIVLTIEYQEFNKDTVMTTIFDNTNETYRNILFSFNFSYLSNGSETTKYYQQNIYQASILSALIMENFQPTASSLASFAGSIAFSILAYLFYVLGYKHNQLLFYIQTMSFMGFVIERTPIANVVFLVNLRYAYFNYDHNPLSRLIPTNYVEKCPGNYFISSTDCNIVRNLGLTLILALITGVFLLVTRMVYYFVRTRFRIDVKFIHYKKLTYRTLEFLHKATMFPLIFFSILTLTNTDNYVLIGQEFKRSCNILSICILIIYFGYTLLQIFFNIMSTLYKIENLVEFITDIFVSLAIIKAQNNYVLISVIFLILIKDIIYSYFRNKYMNQKSSFILLIATAFSMAAMFMVIFKSNRWAMVVVHVVTGIIHLIVYSLLTYWFMQMGKFDKIVVVPVSLASHTDLLKFEDEE